MLSPRHPNRDRIDRADHPAERRQSGIPLVIGAPTDLPRRPRRVAIGTFDGVHRGHAAIIRGCDTVVAFDPHPLTVTAPNRAPRLLTTLSDRVELLAQLGVRELALIRFDAAVREQAAADFVAETLVGCLQATHVSVGENFRFGARAAGDVAWLRAHGAFGVATALVERDGRTVSSSWVREAIAAGDVETAAALLGRPHRLRVTAGDRTTRAATPVWFPSGFAAPPAGRYDCTIGAPPPADAEPPRRRCVVEVSGRPPRAGRAAPDAYVRHLGGDARGRGNTPELVLEFVRRIGEPARLCG
jgi:riboflavin kinase/FMN adenylyltransferase